jgi:hypothetical protein
VGDDTDCRQDCQRAGRWIPDVRVPRHGPRGVTVPSVLTSAPEGIET